MRQPFLYIIKTKKADIKEKNSLSQPFFISKLQTHMVFFEQFPHF